MSEAHSIVDPYPILFHYTSLNSFEKIPYINGDNNNFQKINENFEIYDKENTKLESKDTVSFISTLHGG